MVSNTTLTLEGRRMQSAGDFAVCAASLAHAGFKLSRSRSCRQLPLMTPVQDERRLDKDMQHMKLERRSPDDL